MSIHTIKASQKLPISLQEAWNFISSPYNLIKITPADMTPEITNGILPGDKMYSGQIISYKIKPFPGIKLEWITEIKEVSEFRYFIDEQLSGPFSMWRHEHSLIPIEGGIQMDDVLQYRVPFGVAGNIVNSILIRNKLNNLFTYRYKKLEEIFGKF